MGFLIISTSCIIAFALINVLVSEEKTFPATLSPVAEICNSTMELNDPVAITFPVRMAFVVVKLLIRVFLKGSKGR